MATAKFLRWAIDEYNWVNGNHNQNPILNALLYICKYQDGTTKEYTDNIIAENVLRET